MLHTYKFLAWSGTHTWEMWHPDSQKENNPGGGVESCNTLGGQSVDLAGGRGSWAYFKSFKCTNFIFRFHRQKKKFKLGVQSSRFPVCYQVNAQIVHLSIHFLNPLLPVQGHRDAGGYTATARWRWGTPWTVRQSIAGKRKDKDRQPHAHHTNHKPTTQRTESPM